MKKVYVFLAEGFEEIEAVGTVDILRRSGIETILVSTGNSLQVTGAHSLTLSADVFLHEITDADAFILPGGLPGADNLFNNLDLRQRLLTHHAQHKLVAAICAAPFILGKLKLLQGRRATCYPGFEMQLEGATVTYAPVEVDLPFITARGPAYVFPFALAIVEALLGRLAADKTAQAALLTEAKNGNE
ncbi:MAG: DJ-1/PfpI family protein [Tannerellaceae bacterium]|jgi:4-methyl-5(b-hydroxyethyl)-thiazole monophosphate biosynthesis|nr:DJ-1/PfpI family protein [Tannerellaceae bacterium]